MPKHPGRNRLSVLQQRPHFAEKVRRRPRRQHPCLDESRERRDHHQHRGQVVLALTDGQRPVRGPVISPEPEPRLVETGRSAGFGAAYSGRIAATFARNSDAEPDHPTRSASVAAGIVGVFTNNSRTLGENASKLDIPAAR